MASGEFLDTRQKFLSISTFWPKKLLDAVKLLMNKCASSDYLLALRGSFAIVRYFRHDPSLSRQVTSGTKQKRSLAVGTYCSVLSFSDLMVSNYVANVNNLVFTIDEENLLYSFLLLKLLGQKFLYCSIAQLTHSPRVDNDIAGLFCCSLKIALDSRQLIGLWRLNFVQDAVDHNICCFCFMVVTNGDALDSEAMLSQSMGSLQLVIPRRNTSWNNNFSRFVRHRFHFNKKWVVKAKGFENKTNASKFEASSYLLFILAGCESVTWRPLISDFILVGQKLENLGFVYGHGSVVIIEHVEYQNV
jgi:hypothetical protein